MRGKKAKELRNQARAATAGFPERDYRLLDNPPRVVRLIGGGLFHINTHQLVLHPNCTRGNYQRRKRESI